MAKGKSAKGREALLAKKYYDRFANPAIKEMLVVKTNVRNAMANYLYNNGFLEITAINLCRIILFVIVYFSP